MDEPTSSDKSNNTGREGVWFTVLFGAILIMLLVQQREFLTTTTTFYGKSAAPVTVKISDERSDFFTSIDVLDVQKDFLKIEGWASLPDLPATAQKTLIVLMNQTDTIGFSVIPTARHDVAEALKSDDFLYAGFKFIYPTCKIKPGEYQIGFLIHGADVPKLKFMDRSVRIPEIHKANCDESSAADYGDNVSLQDFYYGGVRKWLKGTRVVGYVGDPIPSPFYEIKSGEAQYALAPTLVVVMRGEARYDTLIGYFPGTRNPENKENPLHEQRDKWRILEDFDNGILLLVKKDLNQNHP